MSQVIYEITEQNIDIAYREHNEHVIEKETDYVLGKVVTIMLGVFSDKLMGITFDKSGIRFSTDYLLSEKHRKNLLKWLKRLATMEMPPSDLDFGKIKIDLENWYYQMGGEGIHFEYHENYLLTPREASEQLGVSKVTLNKYIQQGLECVDTTSHKKIPKCIIKIWRDPVYAIRLQMIAQEKKRRNQSPTERLQEINNDLTELQIKYKSATYQEAFQEFDGDSMDDPSDYYTWRDLEEEKREIIDVLGGPSIGKKP
ncbi:DNA-binding protein [Sporosarcina limicola]|uniref:DNA-binding transcriptional MerR regulator n=1 Tax=Sporosarcina limicola TaxID=34101 RepID=A0A927ML53_9BACL|nr:DNA-binding protein [Sporosarcina limicola]MBE1553211.1 DNA-binding transcriptional MerR regulator [Sporosarcina limicola]